MDHVRIERRYYDLPIGNVHDVTHRHMLGNRGGYCRLGLNLTGSRSDGGGLVKG